jgi:hypothetical protein
VDRLGADAGLEDLAELLGVIPVLLVGEQLLDRQRLERALRGLDIARQALGVLLKAITKGARLLLELLTPLRDLGVGLALQVLLPLLDGGLDLIDLLLHLLGQLAGELVLEQGALLDDHLLVLTFADGEVSGGLLALLRLDLVDQLLGTRGHGVDRLVERFLDPFDVGLGLFLLGLDPVVEIVLQLFDGRVPLLLELDDAVVVLRRGLGEVLLAGVLIDVGDDVVGEVEDLLQVARRHVEQQAHPGRDALEVPDMTDRRGQLDMAHALAADLGTGDLHAALVADDPLVAVPLVLAAVALPVALGPEDALAEEPIALRLEGAVVDRLRLGHLAMRPRQDGLRRCQREL